MKNREARQKRIIELLGVDSQISINDLVSICDVSIETIRRDLTQLEREKQLVRTHGGAVAIEHKDIGNSFLHRQRERSHGKKVIASLALNYVSEGAVIGLDASSTSWHVAQLIPNISLTVVTSSLEITHLLSKKKNIHIINTGGSYSSKYASFYGHLTTQCLSRVSLDVAFISCSAFNPNTGVWESNDLNASVKQAMMKAAGQVILLSDASKINRRGLIQLTTFESIDVLICDEALPESELGIINKKNVLFISPTMAA
ncbi:DeoR/GlpR family DNA-binding transcription regulator [Vibrio sp. DNB22_10_4]